MKRPVIRKINLKAIAGTKHFRLGTYTTATTAVVIALLVVLNLCVSVLPEKYTAFDTTASGLYSISDQTKETVGGLEEDVTIYYIIQEGSEDETLLQLLEHYKDLSSHINIEHVDPVQQPNFATKYTSSQVYTNSFVVTAGEKSRYIDYYDIYETSYGYDDSGNYTTSTSFNGEGALTSAIGYVTSEAETVLYTLQGHGEQALSDGLIEAIESANMELENLNLLTSGSIPQDADCLIIHAPASDLSTEEADLLKDYLAGGGRLMLFTEYQDESLNRLMSVMEEYGLSQIEGMLIEGDADYYVQNYANYLLPEIVSHEITDPLLQNGYLVMMPFAQGINIDESVVNEAEADVSVLLRTTSEAYSRVDWSSSSAAFNESDLTTAEGFPVGVAISSPSGTRAVWFASAYLGHDQMNESVSGANFDLILNSLGWICEMEDSITIHAKSLDETFLTLTSAQSTRWTLVFVGVVPLAFLVSGIVMWRKRRKL